MKKDSPIRLLPGYISFSFPVQIGLYPGNKQAECQGAKKYPIIPIGISDFSKSVPSKWVPSLVLFCFVHCLTYLRIFDGVTVMLTLARQSDSREV